LGKTNSGENSLQRERGDESLHGVSLRGGSERTAGLYTWQGGYARILLYRILLYDWVARGLMLIESRGQLALSVYFMQGFFY
jgi:hypothetical protein